MRSRLSLLCLLIAFQFVSAPVSAQQDPCTTVVQDFIAQNPGVTGNSVYAILNRDRARGCILGPTDRSGIENRYQTLFSNTASSAQKAVARTEVFDLAVEEFSEWDGSICDSANDPVCMVGRHVNQIQELKASLVSSASDPDPGIVNQDNWFVQAATGEIRISNVNVSSFLADACATDVTDTQCRDAIALSGSFMRTSLAMNQVIAAYRLPIIEANAEFLSLRDREWDAYFNEISVQWPWELYVNSRRFTKKNRDQLGNFPRAPNKRWIVLHPSLGFEHIKAPGGDTSTGAAVFVEIAGFERWAWRDGQARNRWGLSVIASFANIPNMDGVGYGAFLHTPIKNMSIGAVWRDGDAGSETGIVANFNIAALLQEYGNLDLADFLTPQ